MKIERSIDRYLRAFEAGTLPEAACSRIKALSEQVLVIRRHRDQLDDESDEPPVPGSPAELSELRSRVREAIATGSPAVVKELLGALVHEIRVESRRAIRPVFRVPEGAGNKRAVSRTVPVGGPYGTAFKPSRDSGTPL